MAYEPWTFFVEIAPDKSPLDLPSGGDWVALTHKVRGFSIDQGQQDTLGEFTPGSCTLLLDNGDEDLDQLVTGSEIGDDHALPSTPVRLRATRTADAWSGATAYVIGDVVASGGLVYRCKANHTNHVPPNATYWVEIPTQTRFSGYTLDGWSPTGSPRGSGLVTVPLTDWIGWAASIPLWDCAFALWVAASQPQLWWRGDTKTRIVDSGNYGVYSEAPRWNGGNFADARVTGGLGVSGEASLVPGSSNPSLLVTSAALLELDPLTLVGSSNKWAIAVFFKTSLNGKRANILSGDNWQLKLDASGYLEMQVNVNAVSFSATIAVAHNDDAVHMVICDVESVGGAKGIYLYSDLGTHFTAITQTATSGGGQIASLDATHDVYIDEVVYWDDFSPADPGASQANCSAWKTSAPQFWDSDTRAGRFSHLCAAAAAGVPTLDATLADASLGLWSPVMLLPTTLASGVIQLGTDGLGACWVTRDGAVRIRDASFTSADADDYTTVLATFSDDPAASGVVRCTRERTGTRLDRVINDVEVISVGQPIPVVHPRDVTSQTLRGKRPKSYTTQLLDYSSLETPAGSFVTARKDPHSEVTVTVMPWGSQTATDFVMESLDLERRVAYREATYRGGTVVVDDEFRVIHVTENYTGATGWTVKLNIAPV